MARKSALTVNLEYCALRTAVAVVNMIPYRIACLGADITAWCLFSIFRFKRQRTLDRIFSVFPEISFPRAKQIAVSSLANILKNAIEMMRALSFDKQWITSHVKDIDLYHAKLKAIIDEGHGAVIMVPHSGNWYMAAWAMAKYGLPLFAIAARQRNPKINAWMQRHYGDIEVVERGNASVMRAILSGLRKGKGFAILPDLRSPASDTEVEFLNGRANISHSGAMFAISTNAPVVIAIMRRENGKHTFDHLGTIRPDPDAPDRKLEAQRIMREAMALIDDAVKKTPEHWYWYNKRWILQPV